MNAQNVFSSNVLISFVIPLYNEMGNLAFLVDEIENECSALKLKYEIVLVDDGSTDLSWKVVSELAGDSAHVKGVRLRRRSGKGAALTAGFEKAHGEIIFTLDADGQDSPSDIGKFLEKINSGWDFVVGWRRDRKDILKKRLVSTLYNNTVRLLGGTDLHDHNCGFKCFRANVIRDLCLYGENHRYFPLMAQQNGFFITEVVVDHRKRRTGVTKYGSKRLLEGAFDFATFLFLKRFRFKPLHLLGVFGLVSFLVGLFGITYLAAIWVLGTPIGGRPLLIYSAVAVLFGFQCILTGLLAELITSYSVRKKDLYLIKEITKEIVSGEEPIEQLPHRSPARTDPQLYS